MITAPGFSRPWCSLRNYASIPRQSHSLLLHFFLTPRGRCCLLPIVFMGGTTSMLVRFTLENFVDAVERDQVSHALP